MEKIPQRITEIIFSLRSLQLRVDQIDQSLAVVKCVNELAKISNEIAAAMKEDKQDEQPG